MHTHNMHPAWADAEDIKHFYTEELLNEVQIAGLYGYSPEIITEILRTMAIEFRPKGWKPEERLKYGRNMAWKHIEEIVRLYTEELLSSPQIAERYECDSKVISRMLHSKGVELRDPHAKHEAWTDAEVIKRLYTEEFMSSPQIGEIYKCQGGLIHRILHSQGVKLRDPHTKHTAWKQKKKIVQLYTKKRMSTYQIAQAYDCSHRVIAKILRSEGVKLRNPNAKHPAWEHKEKITQLYIEELLSPQKIAKFYDCSSPVIRKILRSMGVELRSYGWHSKGKVPPNKHFAWKQVKKITWLYTQERMSASRIAEQYGCNPRLIRNILLSVGVKLQRGKRAA